MVFLPIVERELRVAARQPATYHARVQTASVGILFGGAFWILFAGFFGVSTTGGGQAFETLTGLAFLYCAFGGLAATADSLSSEKREGTLGFLFLTNLKGYDVVLGKLLSSSLRLVYGLIAVLPILSIPVMQGGIRGSVVFGKALVLLNTLFFSASLGLVVSAFSRRRDRALGAAIAVLLFFWLGLPALARLCAYASFPPLITRLLTVFSLGYPSAATPWGTGSNTSRFWFSLLATHCVGWLFLLTASWILPRVWQDTPMGSGESRWRDRWNRWVHGPPESRARRRARLLNLSPFLWLSSRRRFKPVPTWTGILLLIGVLLWLWRYDRAVFGNSEAVLFVALLTHTVLRFSVAAQAVEPIAMNRREGTLELLLCTPLSVADIVRGQWLALRRQYLGPLVVVLLIDIALILLVVIPLMPGAAISRFGQERIVILVGLGQMVMLVTDIIAIGWVGMWMAISSQRVNQAAGGAVARILFLPGLMFLAWNAAGGLLAMGGGVPFVHSLVFNYAVWLSIGLFIDLAFALRSRHQLLGSFRVRAASQYEPEKRPGWRKRSKA